MVTNTALDLLNNIIDSLLRLRNGLTEPLLVSRPLWRILSLTPKAIPALMLRRLLLILTLDVTLKTDSANYSLSKISRKSTLLFYLWLPFTSSLISSLSNLSSKLLLLLTNASNPSSDQINEILISIIDWFCLFFYILHIALNMKSKSIN